MSINMREHNSTLFVIREEWVLVLNLVLCLLSEAEAISKHQNFDSDDGMRRVESFKDGEIVGSYELRMSSNLT